MIVSLTEEPSEFWLGIEAPGTLVRNRLPLAVGGNHGLLKIYLGRPTVLCFYICTSAKSLKV